MNSARAPRKGDALVIVDVQNDFLPGGALAVPRGDEVIPVLNRCIELFQQRALPIFATRDWHPSYHCSFQEQGGRRPRHCVLSSDGANIPPDLKLPPASAVVSKASTPEREAYPGFEDTNLEEKFCAAQIKRLFVGGLPTNYCVLNTVLDARRLGFEVFLLRDAVRAVNAQPGDGEKAEQEMSRSGAKPIELSQLAS
jgi:nicotinamidase/pyrazinamidase